MRPRFIVAGLFALGEMHAQSNPPVISSEMAASPSPPSALNANPPIRARAVSPETAQRISLNAPKFIPPKPEGEKAPPAPDLRETDKPKNGIIRLPDYLVRAPQQPLLKDRELLTSQGKLDLAYKRHPGLRLGSPYLKNDGVARYTLEEELRLERMAEMSDALSVLRAGGGSVSNDIKAKATDIFIRHNDWVSSGAPWREAHPYP